MNNEREELAKIIFENRKPWVTNTEHRAMEQEQAGFLDYLYAPEPYAVKGAKA